MPPPSFLGGPCRGSGPDPRHHPAALRLALLGYLCTSISSSQFEPLPNETEPGVCKLCSPTVMAHDWNRVCDRVELCDLGEVFHLSHSWSCEQEAFYANSNYVPPPKPPAPYPPFPRPPGPAYPPPQTPVVLNAAQRNFEAFTEFMDWGVRSSFGRRNLSFPPAPPSPPENAHPSEPPFRQFTLSRRRVDPLRAAAGAYSASSLRDFDLLVPPGRRVSSKAACWRGQEKKCHGFPTTHPCDLEKFAACLFFKDPASNLGEVVVELTWKEPSMGDCLSLDTPQEEVTVEGSHPVHLLFDSTTFREPEQKRFFGALGRRGASFQNRLVKQCPDVVDLVQQLFRTSPQGTELYFGNNLHPSIGDAAPAQLAALHYVGYSRSNPDGAGAYATFLPVLAPDFSMDEEVPALALPSLDVVWFNLGARLGNASARCHADTGLRFVKAESLAPAVLRVWNASHGSVSRWSQISQTRVLALRHTPDFRYWPEVRVTVRDAPRSIAMCMKRKHHGKWREVHTVQATFRSLKICSGTGSDTQLNAVAQLELQKRTAQKWEVQQHIEELQQGLAQGHEAMWYLGSTLAVVGLLAVFVCLFHTKQIAELPSDAAALHFTQKEIDHQRFCDRAWVNEFAVTSRPQQAHAAMRQMPWDAPRPGGTRMRDRTLVQL
ncbi:hypothetical protein CYMTET_47204 [Cymbomonas tetramitiformis]|uniref:Uncharacterized protein n=1 Tax=Cymbomonas tetramitiformis TaxID=36881 RepID=A0AAE0BVT6_9CHLO|nr:hypothetical protein CYMTET_47204 [Cymbomonas tetramitiformis]